MEQRIRFTDYKGKKILLEDFSNVKDEDELIKLIDEALKVVQSQPPKSALVVVDMTNANLTPKVYQHSKAATETNTDYIKATTLVGLGNVLNILAKAVSSFARRDLVSFGTREEAMEWLIQQ